MKLIIFAISILLLTAKAVWASPVYVFYLPGSSTTNFSTVVADSRITGAVIECQWSVFEPSKGTFSSACFDNIIALLPAGKKFKIDLMTGQWSPTGWLATDGVPLIQFKWDQVQPSGGIFPNFCDTVSYPVPWNATYQADLKAAQDQLMALYGSNPNFIGIKLTGVGSYTDEVFFPTRNAVTTISNGVTSCSTFNDIANLVSAGYSQSNLESAFNTINANWVADFPNVEAAPEFIAMGFPNAAVTAKEQNIQKSGAGIINFGPMEAILDADARANVPRYLRQNCSWGVNVLMRDMDIYQEGGPMGSLLLGGVSLLWLARHGVAREYELLISDLLLGIQNPGSNNDIAITLMAANNPQYRAGGYQ